MKTLGKLLTLVMLMTFVCHPAIIKKSGVIAYHSNTTLFHMWDWGNTPLVMRAGDTINFLADSASSRSFSTESMGPAARVLNSVAYNIPDSLLVCADLVRYGAADTVAFNFATIARGATFVPTGGSTTAVITTTESINCVKRQFFPKELYRLYLSVNANSDSVKLYNMRVYSTYH